MLPIKTKMINKKLKFIIPILIVIMVGIIFANKIDAFSKEKEEEKQISSFFDLQKELIQDTQKLNPVEGKISKEDYVGMLEIPKINLQKGFYSMDSKLNTVNIGLEVIKNSKMPDVENSELVIAGHSGNGYLAFFKDLNKVEKGDLIYITYQGYQYIYKLKSTTITDKNGEIEVEKEEDSQTLILTTCNPSNREKEQLTLVSSLIETRRI